MVRRHVGSDFAPDVYVFPGGKVDESDRDTELAAVIATSPSRTGAQFSDDDSAFRMAALRELFEEAGVLLATDGSRDIVEITGDRTETYARLRKQLHDGAITLFDLGRQTGLRFAIDRLQPFSRWITPAGMPRRYDTRFYLAQTPDGQEPLHDAVETTHGTWIAPDEALRRHEDGDFPLVFATVKHLERMRRFPTLNALFAGVSPADLAPITPRAVRRDGEAAFLLPGDAGYAGA
jgi:8-oxo-dGTP pyrophosphatase MutT (NUDIX family)